MEMKVKKAQKKCVLKFHSLFYIVSANDIQRIMEILFLRYFVTCHRSRCKFPCCWCHRLLQAILYISNLLHVIISIWIHSSVPLRVRVALNHWYFVYKMQITLKMSQFTLFTSHWIPGYDYCYIVYCSFKH